MTTAEFKNEFNIHYNAIATQSAPSIDDYELSVYLTKAQLEVIKNYYDPASNRKLKGFENSEKRRVDLKELIKEFDTNTVITTTLGLTNNSKFFKIPDETFLIIYESLKCNIDNCGETELSVVPKTHDEFNIQYRNPFKRPNKNKVWRLDISKINNDKVVELITPYIVSNYKLRYIKYPKPIIISNLSTSFPGENLSINGFTNIQQCELDQEIHPEILDRAVQLALRDYKPSNLESKIQLDQRNE
jgi:hypothetical protein